MRSNNLGNQKSASLRDPRGREWAVNLTVGGSQLRQRMCSGWHDFYTSNALKNGDICVFKLRPQNLTQTTIFFDVEWGTSFWCPPCMDWYLIWNLDNNQLILHFHIFYFILYLCLLLLNIDYSVLISFFIIFLKLYRKILWWPSPPHQSLRITTWITPLLFSLGTIEFLPFYENPPFIVSIISNMKDD